MFRLALLHVPGETWQTPEKQTTSGGITMDDIDKELLNRIQSDFPVTSRPFLAIGNELGISETDVIGRITRLKESGIIRRIGGNIVPHKLGFVSTLCAASVPENRVDEFADVVNQYPGVTHNYQRNHDMNMWFTFIAPSMQEIETHLDAISRQTGITGILNMPATRVFKIRAHFDLS
ncbi:MAG: AsnC family transcriptional regulator [Desulfatirhabdiaceae bacterium]